MTTANVHHPSPPGAPWRSTAVAAVCAAIAGLVFAYLGAPESIWSARLIDHPGYAPIDAVAVQQSWPTYLAGLAGVTWAAGVGAVLLLVALVRRIGGGSLAAAAAALSMAFGGIFWSRAAGGHPAIFGAMLSLATLAALLEWRDRRSLIALSVAAAAMGATIATQPATLLALPIVIFAAVTLPGLRSGQRFAALGLLVAAAAVGVWWASRALGIDATGTGWILPHGLSAVISRLSAGGSLLVSDFGVLGLAFALAGLAALAVQQRPAFTLLAGWCLLVGLGSLLWAAPDWRSSALPALAPAWAIVGAGMQWLLSRPGGTRRVAAGLIILLPVISFAGHYWMGARAITARRFVTSYLDALHQVVGSPVVVIAEGGPIDREIENARAGQTSHWSRVAQDPDLIAALMAAGRPVLGFDGARANLSALGFRFRPIGGTGVLMTPDELLDTVPPGWIVAIAGGSRFGQWMPRQTQPGLAAIGARTQTFGSSRRYVVIGVKDSGVEALEQTGTRADVMVRAGDAATGATRRWPADLRAWSDTEGGVIEYGGRQVARTASGIALVVLSPTGSLEGVFNEEFSADLRLPVQPAGFNAALVAGREPCATMTGADWTDLSAQATRSSLTALLGPGQRLVVYLASDRRLTPRGKVQRHPHEPALHVETFNTRNPKGAESLASALTRDGLIHDRLGAAPLIFRVEITAQGAGPSQLALRLGGSAERAVARLLEPGATGRVEVCSEMRGGAGLFADPDVLVQEVDLASQELLPYGWDRLEHNGPRLRRWTRVPEADVLVPLARTGPFALELVIEPAGPAGTRLDMRVNGVAAPTTTLREGVHTYRIEVPAEAWREGMNHVTVATSALVRPSDVSASRDDRQLGVAVSGFRLLR